MRCIFDFLMLSVCICAGSSLPAADKGGRTAVDQIVDPEGQLMFPADAGHVDVAARYGLAGDGKTDDTAGFQRAISENLDYHSRILWLRNGTYLVSDTLETRYKDGRPFFGMKLVCQSRAGVVIRLMDRCPGFGDPVKPRAVVKTNSRDSEKGGMAHWNSLINLTIHTGIGNPGAIGVDYLCNNIGSISNVTIQSGDGAGVCGVSMMRDWPGPCLFKNVSVIGFDTAFQTRCPEYSITFEDIFCRGQRQAVFQDGGNILCIRNLRTQGAAPVFVQKLPTKNHRRAQLVLLDSQLMEGDPSRKALQPEDAGFTYIRNVRSSGWGGVLAGEGASVGEWCTPGKAVSQFPTMPGSLGLPIADTPVIPYDPPQTWARGGKARETQAAIDSGASTVYIPYGEYRYDTTIIIRKNVKRIIGMSANIWRTKEMAEKDLPLWRFEETRQPAVMLEHMDTNPFVHATSSAVVLRHLLKGGQLSGLPGCGPLFIEDVCASAFTIAPNQSVWARHLNSERADWDIRNTGGRLWILGFKTERPALTVATTQGGYTEILGGLIYPCGPCPDEMPMLLNEDSHVSAILRATTYKEGNVNRIKVREVRAGAIKDLEKFSDALYGGFTQRVDVTERTKKKRK